MMYIGDRVREARTVIVGCGVPSLEGVVQSMRRPLSSPHVTILGMATSAGTAYVLQERCYAEGITEEGSALRARMHSEAGRLVGLNDRVRIRKGRHARRKGIIVSLSLEDELMAEVLNSNARGALKRLRRHIRHVAYEHYLDWHFHAVPEPVTFASQTEREAYVSYKNEWIAKEMDALANSTYGVTIARINKVRVCKVPLSYLSLP